jgi:serine/threonine protein kinase/formylglycine-generating enzyme required for sulfatase activity
VDDISDIVTRLRLSAEDEAALHDLVRRAASQKADTVLLPQSGAGPRTVREIPLESSRYQDRGRIATGGMGEVRRVFDQVLDRPVAMKVLRPDLSHQEHLVRRFVEEAKLTAQLQHPNVVAVHEIGRLPNADGHGARWFFTMKEVRGHTLTEVIDEVHGVSREGAWGTSTDGWTLRRMVDVFHKVCLTVAFAHDHGVVHGDLKPDNVMVGAYGEVQLMDWGLSARLQETGYAPDVGITGTPVYMAPEQARGTPRSRLTDVYSLGATLYHMLSGQLPFPNESPQDVVMRLVRGERPVPLRRVEEIVTFSETRAYVDRTDPGEGTCPPIPRELADAVTRAMATEKLRTPSAQALAEQIEGWLEGSRKAEELRTLVAQATSRLPEVRALRERARGLRERAQALTLAVPRSAPDLEKREIWALEDQAGELEGEADRHEADVEGTLRAVTNLMPGLPEAHEALARQLRDHHEQRERSGDTRGAEQVEVRLRAHVRALPPSSALRNELQLYLKGDGEVHLLSDPPGARVAVHKQMLVDRRLMASPTSRLSATPVRARLAMGSYVLVLHFPAGPGGASQEVRYPVLIERNARWTGIPPGTASPEPIRLPAQLGPDECCVPAGWAKLGDTEQGGARPLWVDSFVIDRFPVTNRQYLEFLNDLASQGRGEEALRHAPRERTGTGLARTIYVRDERGRFSVGTDEDGDAWDPDWPVVLIDWDDANAYAAWRAQSTGLPWRLPSEWEWEKAARGVDGRSYPWGDHAEDTWACTLHAHTGRPLLSVVDSYPEDESPYGVRGCAGNVHEWCLEPHAPPRIAPHTRAPRPPAGPSDLRITRGGAWNLAIRHARCAMRHGTQAHSRLPYIGFRLARPV